MPLREGTNRDAVGGALGLNRRAVQVQRGISKFHSRRCAVVKKLEAVQNLQDNRGWKTRSRTHEVEEYNCMPYMQLRLLERFEPTCDGRERGLEAGGIQERVRGAKAVKERAAQNQRVKNRVGEYMPGGDDNWATARPSTRELEQRQAVVASLGERKPEEDMRRTGRARSTGLSRGVRVV